MNDACLLLKGLQANDEKAYARLHASESQGLMRALLHQGFVANEDEFYTVFHDALLAVGKLAVNFHSDSEVRSALYVIARNKAIDCFRRSQSSQAKMIVFRDCDEDQTPAPPDFDAYAAIDNERRVALMHKAIDRLKGQQKIVMAGIVQKMTPSEIADAMKLSLNAVYTIRKRAYEQLKQDIQAMMSGDAKDISLRFLLLLGLLGWFFYKKS